MNEEIKVVLEVETKSTGKSIPDLSDNFNAFVTVLKAADSNIKKFEGTSKDLAAAMKALSKDTAAVTAAQKATVAAANVMEKNIDSAAKKIRDYNNSLLSTPKAMLDFVKAEKLAGGSLSNLTAAYEAESKKMQQAAQRRNKYLADAGNKALEAMYKGTGAGASPQMEKLNQSVLSTAAAYYKAESALDGYQTVLTDTMGELSRFKGVSAKAMDGLIVSSAESSRYINLLNAEIQRLSTSTAKPGSKTFADNQLKIAEFTAALNTKLKEENALIEKQNGLLAKSNTVSKTKQLSATGTSGGLSGRLSSSDTAALANLSRLGVISPQIAQLSTVMGVLTSTSMVAAAGVVAVGVGLVTMTKASVAAAAELQGYRVILQGLSTHGWDEMEKNSEATMALGAATASGMVNYATQSVYAFEKIASGTEKLVGYGFDIRTVNTDMEMLGNLALGDSKRLENLAVAYGQVFGQGKARAQEMYQFVNAGIPIFEILAQKLGISTAAVMDMVRSGEVSFDLMKETLSELTAEGGRYHDLMRKIANLSFGGQMTMLMNNLKVMLSDMAENVLPALTEALAGVNRAFVYSRDAVTKDKIMKLAMSRERNQFDLTVYDQIDTGQGNALYETLLKQQERALTVRAIQDSIVTGKTSERSQKMVAARAAVLTTPEFPIAKELLEHPYSISDKAAPTGQEKAQIDAMVKRAKWLDERTKAYDSLFKYLVEDMGVEQADIDKLKKSLPKYGVESSIGKKALGRAVSGSEVFFGGDISTDGLTAETVQLWLDKTFSRLSNNVLDKPEQKFVDDWARVQEKRNITPKKSILDEVGPGTDTRDFLVPKYTADLKEQERQLRELVPLYREYVNIQIMSEKDRAKIIKDDGTEIPGMPDEQANIEQRKAKQQFAKVEVLKQVTAAYEFLYTQQNENNNLMEADIQLAAEELKTKMLLRGETDALANSVFNLSMQLVKSGSTVPQVAAAYDELMAAMGLKTSETPKKSAFQNLIENWDEFRNVMNGTRAKDNPIKDLTEDFRLFVEEITGDKFLEALANVKQLMGTLDGKDTKAQQSSGVSSFITAILGAEKLSETGQAAKLRKGLSGFNAQSIAENTGTDIKDFSLNSSLGTALTFGLKGSPEDQLKQLEKKQMLEAELAKQVGPGSDAETYSVWRKAKEDLDEYVKSMERATTVGKVFWDMTEDLATNAASITFASMNDALYDMGYNLMSAAEEQKNLADVMDEWGKAMINMLPSVLLSGAQAAFTAGEWPLGLALLAASGVASGVGGMLGSKEDKNKDDGKSAELQALQNLKEQFQIMIQQFQENILYLDAARARYAVDSQMSLMTGYANGDVFQGATGLKQGVYNQPTFFRFANGGQFSGVMGEAGAEAVMPLTRGSDGKLGVQASGGTGGIIINNYSGATITESQQTDERGNKQTVLLIEKAVGNMMAAGKFDGPMGSRYGSRPQAVRRTGN